MILAGLTPAEVERRLALDGANTISRAKPKTRFTILLAQLASPVIWLLLGAAIVSAVLGEMADTIAIAAIVVINAGVGFAQEFRAEKALLALRALTAPKARVRRGGISVVVPAADLVVGDLLLLEAGDVTAADARLVEAHELTMNEALLTGESVPVGKTMSPVAQDAALAERYDCVFLGTAVARGTGVATVFATGMRTELGKIAHLLETAEVPATPLERRLAGLSRSLLIACLCVVALIATLGLLRHAPWLEVVLSSVSLAVAAVPEGLPALVTIALALGVQRMASRHVLVRRMHAVETLGCTTVICTDKTGTLTTGTMAVRDLWSRTPDRLLFAAAACCDAELSPDHAAGVGDTTELALLVEAAKRGIHKAEIEKSHPRVHVIPFDSQRRRMSIQRSDGVLYVKGAVEEILQRCAHGTEGAAAANTALGERGLRVLAIATGATAEESNLTLLGLVGIADPPRPEAIEAIRMARAAGIRTVMITGDHLTTAHAIARELGLLADGDDPSVVVHARATAATKLAIVRDWKERGAVVAMTGDGVNDAPAIKEANIGIAMGRGGTEVTREAADMVLTDDNFASIVAAVREGRGIYDNIRKTVVYLLSGNLSELLIFVVAAIVGWSAPLLPLQILWVNLVTDGLPALALVTDPLAEDVLARAPRGVDEPLLRRSEWLHIVWTGILNAAVTLVVFFWALSTRDLDTARSFAFSSLVFGEVFRALAARSASKVFWQVGAFSNLKLVAVVVGCALFQLVILQSSAVSQLLGTRALDAADTFTCLAAGLVPVSIIEITKLARVLLPVSRPTIPAGNDLTRK